MHASSQAFPEIPPLKNVSHWSRAVCAYYLYLIFRHGIIPHVNAAHISHESPIYIKCIILNFLTKHQLFAMKLENVIGPKFSTRTSGIGFSIDVHWPCTTRASPSDTQAVPRAVIQWSPIEPSRTQNTKCYLFKIKTIKNRWLANAHVL